MNSWLTATLIAGGLLVLAAFSSLALYNWRDNRWIASGAFFLTVACVAVVVPAFFVIGFGGAKW